MTRSGVAGIWDGRSVPGHRVNKVGAEEDHPLGAADDGPAGPGLPGRRVAPEWFPGGV